MPLLGRAAVEVLLLLQYLGLHETYFLVELIGLVSLLDDLLLELDKVVCGGRYSATGSLNRGAWWH